MRKHDSSARRPTTSLLAARPVRVIAVTGGKGGVGKTIVALNLAASMAAAGRKVMLLDGDLGLANVDVLLGLTPRFTLAHVVAGERSLREVVIETAQGFSIVPAGSGVEKLAGLSDIEHAGLVQAFSDVASDLDTLIVDTAAGIASSVIQLAKASQHVLLVICDEPTSMTDAYALVKVLSRNHGVRRFQVVVNMTRDAEAGANAFGTLSRVAERFLDVTLEFAGSIPDDALLRRSIREQRPVTEAYPSSPSARALKQLGQRADKWPVPSGTSGQIEFFAERLIQRPAPKLEVVR